jgi:predicted TIM-barrel fold metal-dependent hydrolase
MAQKTIDYLAIKGNIKPHSNGTVAGLIEKMDEAGVTLSVALPVLTRPESFDSILNFVLKVNEENKGKIISFAGIHPRCTDIYGKLKKAKDLGIKGVKIHPDYQETFIDDSGYIEILNSCKELDLIVVTHAGHDVAYRDSMKCPPEKLKKVIEKVGHKKLVLAHLGGSMLIDEVTNELAGLDVYMDTANDLKFVTKDKFLKLISKHGEDKILFATDMPWSSMKGDIEIVKNFVEDSSVLDKIFYKNALSLLSL